MTTTEGNKLIAEFDGKKKDSDSPWYRGFDIMIHGVTAMHEETLKYHTSWDWLMPVVEKIESMGYIVSLRSPSGVGQIGKDDQYIQIVPCDSLTLGENRILSVWKAIVAFIQRHNSLNQ